MFEIDEAAKVITRSIDPDAKVKFGAVIDDSMGDEIRITVIATGFDESSKRLMTPATLMLNDEPQKKPKIQEPKFVSAPAQMENRKPMFNPKPAPTIEMAGDFASDDVVAEDELDIPAFIRKKMK
jgi:cell division protein FtsZ